MPIYQYRCPKCHRIQEHIQSIMAQPLRIRCRCGSWLHRIISATNFVLSGKGWARDGYSKGASK